MVSMLVLDISKHPFFSLQKNNYLSCLITGVFDHRPTVTFKHSMQLFGKVPCPLHSSHHSYLFFLAGSMKNVKGNITNFIYFFNCNMAMCICKPQALVQVTYKSKCAYVTVSHKHLFNTYKSKIDENDIKSSNCPCSYHLKNCL